MSNEEESKELRQFDVRTVERSIRRGSVTRKDYDRYLKSLPDAAVKIATPEGTEPTPPTEDIPQTI
jgi:hypothetical protein